MEVPVRYSIKKTDKETLARWFYLLVLGRTLDDRAPNYLKQAIGWSYHAPYAGHDGIQLAIGQVFDRSTDHLFPYYRDMLTTLSAGLTPEEIILNGISKETDIASGGRHMSNHFSKPAWNIHNVSSCTGSHAPQAAGAARAMKKYRHKGVAIASEGESSVSEGYVYEAINGASNEQLPVIFVIQDNGYGISVPKADQTANRKVADNFSGLKHLRIIHCNGKDVFDSMNAMAEAKDWAIKNQKPVIVQANCVRIHSHSNSDRHDLYRDDYELNYVSEYDPLGKYRRLLIRYNRFSDAELTEMEERVKLEVKEAHKKGGIITLSWHHLNPVSDSSAWELTPAVKQILPNGSHHQKFVNDLNHIADFFSGLRDENDNLIPVIFRPYHEFEGNWFWWCQNVTSSEEYIQLWKFTVDFFKGKGLHNILYCYNPGFVSDGIADSYYPGDDYVDLVGIDTYNLDTPIHIEEVDQIIERMIVFCNDHDKIPCISEAGYNGIPQQNWWTKTLAPLVKGKGISYVLLWRNARTDHFFVPFPGHESAPDFIQFIEDNAILSLGDMNRILQNNL